MNSTPISLEIIAKILIRCFWMGIAFQFYLLFWALPGADWAYSVHSKLFDFSRSEFDLMMYGFMGLVKLISIVGFLFPYFAIRLVIRQRS